MSDAEAVLVLVFVPLAIIVIVGALAYIGGPRRDTRYRPGRPYQFSPVWYLANHSRGEEPTGGEPTGEVSTGRELAASEQRRALSAGRGDQPGTGGFGTVGQDVIKGARGGASERW